MEICPTCGLANNHAVRDLRKCDSCGATWVAGSQRPATAPEQMVPISAVKRLAEEAFLAGAVETKANYEDETGPAEFSDWWAAQGFT